MAIFDEHSLFLVHFRRVVRDARSEFVLGLGLEKDVTARGWGGQGGQGSIPDHQPINLDAMPPAH
jgi:hypothetical protein